MVRSFNLPVLLVTAAFVTTALADVSSNQPANVFSPSDSIQPIKTTSKGAANTLGESGDFGGDGNDEQVPNAIDGDPNTKYFNHAQDGSNPPGVNTGFVDTPKMGATVVTKIKFSTGNDLPDRDPLTITLEGSNSPDATKADCKNFELIYEGPCGLDSDPGRNTEGSEITFKNTKAYTSYRILVTKTRNSTDAVQYSEVSLMGVKQ